MLKQNGFTLLELLLVMAIMGIMAVIVFVALNPAELMARSRDTGRITAVAVLGRAVTSYYTTKGGAYPTDSSWDQDLLDIQAVAKFPKGLDYATSGVGPCSTNAKPVSDPSYCYSSDTTGVNGAIVFTKLESGKQRIKCSLPNIPYVVFSTVDGKAGIVCLQTDPSPWPAGTQNYKE